MNLISSCSSHSWSYWFNSHWGSLASKYVPWFSDMSMRRAGTTMVLNVNADCNYLSSIPGGCPDRHACLETCRLCYRGIGIIITYCVAPDWRGFHDGAPCPPPAPPACPKRPPASTISTNWNFWVHEALHSISYVKHFS